MGGIDKKQVKILRENFFNQTHREKYEKKIEKLMMFVYSVMHQQPGSEAITGIPTKKMLPASGN